MTTVVLSPTWAVPVQPAGVVWTDSSVAYRDGVIVAVGTRDDVLREHPQAREVPLPGRVLLPGLVNSHTHAAMTLLRGMADDLPLAEWLNDHIWPTEARWVDEQFVYDGTVVAAHEMIRGGTTCFNDMYFFPDAAIDAANTAGIRMVVGLIVFDAPGHYASNGAEYLAYGKKVHSRVETLPRVTAAIAPHSPYMVSDESWQLIGDLARELELPIHTHINEAHHEAADSIDRYGLPPLQRLARLGILDRHVVAAHMVHLTDDDHGLVVGRNLHVAHCPESNLKLASGFSPTTRLLADGINVAIGTDGAASNNDLDMISETRMAALLAKGQSGSAAAVPAHQALFMATLGGARALGLGDVIGSLEVGKAADCVAIHLDETANHPIYDPVSQVVYTANRKQVSDVWIEGEHLLADGEFASKSAVGVKDKAAAWAERIRPR